jgi:nicotinamide-nucleotide amidase
MAEGALAHSLADIAVSITGIAGPGGGSDLKPVGLVHFACAKNGSQTLHRERRFGDIGRENVRAAAVLQAFDLMEEMAR